MPTELETHTHLETWDNIVDEAQAQQEESGGKTRRKKQKFSRIIDLEEAGC